MWSICRQLWYSLEKEGNSYPSAAWVGLEDTVHSKISQVEEDGVGSLQLRHLAVSQTNMDAELPKRNTWLQSYCCLSDEEERGSTV